MIVVVRFKNFLLLPSHVLHRGTQYTTSEEHNLTHYVYVILAILLIMQLTRGLAGRAS